MKYTNFTNFKNIKQKNVFYSQMWLSNIIKNESTHIKLSYNLILFLVICIVIILINAYLWYIIWALKQELINQTTLIQNIIETSRLFLELMKQENLSTIASI